MAKAALDLGAPAIDASHAAEMMTTLSDQGLDLGPDQTQALAGIMTSGARIETLVGPAGTGKSTVIGALARIWPNVRHLPAGEPPRRVVGLAASQVATDVLSSEGVAARNLTRWLATQERLAGANTQPDDLQWRLAAGNLVVVDEAGTLPTADLIAVHRHITAAGGKLLLTGDHRQLAAVGAGGGMALLASAGGHEQPSERTGRRGVVRKREPLVRRQDPFDGQAIQGRGGARGVHELSLGGEPLTRRPHGHPPSLGLLFLRRRRCLCVRLDEVLADDRADDAERVQGQIR